MADDVTPGKPTLFGRISGLFLIALGLFVLAMATLSESVPSGILTGLAGLLGLGSGYAIFKGG
ncbi:MAG: hypothetical protein HC813_03505 [Planctomycetes bacterium]|nr:hypothetical protein [Planctomycetota bacterium]